MPMLALSLATVLLAAAPARAANPPLDLAAMARIVDLEEPAISPGGDTIALIVVRQDLRHDAVRNELEAIDARSGRARVIAAGDVAVPRWSPDGSQLAYLSTGGAHVQLFVRAANGVTRQLTQAAGDVVDAAWSPDGRRLAFVAADPASKAPFFYAGDNDYTATSLTPADHLWLVDARGGGKPRRLTHGTWTIAPTDPGGIFSPQIAWTSDGKRITFTRIENTFTGDDEASTLWQIDLASGAMRKLTAHSEFEVSPAYSPDGRLSYWYPRGGDYNAENGVRVLTADGDRPIGSRLDRNIAATQWFDDGRLLLCAADGTQNRLWTVDATDAVTPLPTGEIHPVCDPYSSSTFDSGIAGAIARNGTIAFIGTSATSARELYLLEPGGAQPKRLTHFNDFLQRYALGAMSELTWNGPDGFAEDGVVTMPPAGTQPHDGRYPVVLLIHGGPGLSSQRDLVWEQWPLPQMIAARGYIVFQPNYRGSDNLGNAYMLGIVRNTVEGPSADIMAGLAALEGSPDVDATRVAVTGWSYGGELTSWLIGHYHGWRTAISGAAVNSEFDEYDLSTSNVQDRYPLGATPYTGDGWRVYQENSPITYYAQIATPTLIWGTTQDPVVPITQAYALYHALKENGVPVRFAVFPAATHGPDGPRQTAELTRLWLDWLDAHMK